ncbi:MAG TPA: hypothetical protein VGF54_17095 [Streptosporangiaceae bacterium]|jgi:hypothetical protein
MILDPDRYECPDHHTDLTELVQEALEELGPVAYGRRSGARPFQVIVTCPGTGGTEAHRLTCAGTQTP